MYYNVFNKIEENRWRSMKLFKRLFVLLFAVSLGSCAIPTPFAPADVTGVELNRTDLTLTVGEGFQLEAYVKPTNATNKNVTWKVKKAFTNYITVSEIGYVTAKAIGSEDVVVTTEENHFTAVCTVNVVEKIIPVTNVSLSKSTLSIKQGKSSSISATVYPSDASNKTVTWSSSNTAVASVSNGAIKGLSQGTSTITVRTADGGFTASCDVTITEPTRVTGVTLNQSSLTLKVDKSSSLIATVSPIDAYDKSVSWNSSNTAVATVSSSGVITAKSAGNTTITVSTNDGGLTANCNVVVEEKSVADEWTILIYMCGADLESKNQLATSDLQEILKVSNQPDNVNIVIETGGASSWSRKYSISSSKLERWHVENKSLAKDASLTYASMGLTSTFQSFLEYGLKNYPADKTGVILWNHGGAMHGVCYDEKKNDDSLLASEIKSAVSGALSNCGMSGQKLEWIGYDACLMQVQDIAEMNSPYFNYMIASEESESGYGWDYDSWIDDLYAGKDTKSILKAIVDGFISDNGGASSSSSDQTLSYLNLNNISAYKTAWENLATALDAKLTSGNKSSFTNAITNNVKHYADSDYDYYCTFDAKDFVNKLVSHSSFSSFRVDSSITNAVLDAFSNLVTYSVAQKGAGNSNGLCMVWLNDSQYSYKSMYSSNQTNFTNWRELNMNYGTYSNN